MRRSLIATILLLSCVAPVRADMTLILREVDNGVAMHLEGSINTSVVDGGFGTASYIGTGSFRHTVIEHFLNDGSRVVENHTRVASGAVDGDIYYFLNDAALTPVGMPPWRQAGRGPLRAAPPFWFGFNDVNLISGNAGSYKNFVYLTDGYVSNDFISLDFVEPNETLATLGFVPGERWGVSFTDGAGGAQSMIFHAVPEPSTLALALLAAVALVLGIRRTRTLRSP